MTFENMLRGTSTLARCATRRMASVRICCCTNGSGPMEIDLVSLKDREQIGGLTALRLAASRKNKGEDLPVATSTRPETSKSSTILRRTNGMLKSLLRW